LWISAGKDDFTQKRRRIQRRFRGSYREAQKRLRDLETEVDSGIYVPAGNITFNQYVDEYWMPSRRASLSPTTLRGYDSLLRCHIRPVIGEVKLQEVTPAPVAAIVKRLIDSEKMRQAHHAHMLTGTIYRAAIRSQHATKSPVDGIERPRPTRAELEVLTPEQVNQVLGELADVNSWALIPIAVLVTTGLRRSELAGLRWGDLDLNRNILMVQRSYHCLPGGITVVRQPKTARGRRAIALDTHTVNLLKNHHSEYGRQQGLMGRESSRAHYVFARVDGSPWPPDTYSQLWGRLAKKLGLNVTLHGLRHTSASLLLASGANARLISARLGHSTVAFTLDQYSHLLPNADEEAAEKLAQLLSNSRLEIPAAT
jgi:integrase